MTRSYPDGSFVPVVVVGAGPVGVVAATMLAQRGIETLVVERRTGIYPLPRAVHLDDEVHRILQDIGVAEGFAQMTMPAKGLRLVDAELRTMAEFRRSEVVGPHGYPPANMFDQPALEELLRDAMDAEASATLQEGVELIGITAASADSGVMVQLRDVDGSVRTVRAQAVLGCDGANSGVRGLIGASMEDLRFEERWLVIDVRSPVPLDTWPGVYQVCDPARAATYMQVGPGRYRWEFRLHDGETPESLQADPGLETLVRPWLGKVPFDQLEVMRQAEYTFKARIADSWRHGRVFLLGDAAHLTPPFIGQGLCAGLRDAANLTWKLAAVLQGRAAESLLDSYQIERAPHARALVLKARTVGWVMTGGQDAAAHLRRLALAVVCRIPGADTKVLDTAPPRYPDSPAVNRVGRWDRLTGGLVPQPFLAVGSDRRRLDEITGPGYSVLVDGTPDPMLVEVCRRVGATLVQVVEPGCPEARERSWVIAADADVSLLPWLRTARTRAVLVRPDHVVQAREGTAGGGPLAGARLATMIVHWADGLGWRRASRHDDAAAASEATP